MILPDDLTLEAVLGGAVSTDEPEFHVDYLVYNNQGIATKPATNRGELNSTTDVALLDPDDNGYSTQGFVAEVLRLSIYNKDTAAVTVTIKTTDGTTERFILKTTLAAGETLCYQK